MISTVTRRRSGYDNIVVRFSTEARELSPQQIAHTGTVPHAALCDGYRGSRRSLKLCIYLHVMGIGTFKCISNKHTASPLQRLTGYVI
jgi:hypothetical protein